MLQFFDAFPTCSFSVLQVLYDLALAFFQDPGRFSRDLGQVLRCAPAELRMDKALDVLAGGHGGYCMSIFVVSTGLFARFAASEPTHCFEPIVVQLSDEGTRVAMLEVLVQNLSKTRRRSDLNISSVVRKSKD